MIVVRWRIVLATLLAPLLVLAVAELHAADRVARPQKQATSQPAAAIDARIDRDVVYSHNGGVDLHLDLYFPKIKSDQPAPLAIYIHGGAWRTGDKRSGFWMTDVTSELISRGYVVAGVEYRMLPQFKWPAYLYDCKAAVRFMRVNAAKYNIDPNRIGTWGTSAGGHLVSLLGTTDANDKLEGDGGNAEQSSRVQAVVDLFGPVDLTKNRRPDVDEIANEAFGGAEGRKQGSPVRYVTKDDPPFLILQGDADTRVPVDQSQMLLDLLQAAGIESKLIIVKNGGHGLGGTNISPSRAEMVKTIGDFFDKHLKRHE